MVENRFKKLTWDELWNNWCDEVEEPCWDDINNGAEVSKCLVEITDLPEKVLISFVTAYVFDDSDTDNTVNLWAYKIGDEDMRYSQYNCEVYKELKERFFKDEDN